MYYNILSNTLYKLNKYLNYLVFNSYLFYVCLIYIYIILT